LHFVSIALRRYCLIIAHHQYCTSPVSLIISIAHRQVLPTHRQCFPSALLPIASMLPIAGIAHRRSIALRHYCTSHLQCSFHIYLEMHFSCTTELGI
jgi:hypothetical protein